MKIFLFSMMPKIITYNNNNNQSRENDKEKNRKWNKRNISTGGEQDQYWKWIDLKIHLGNGSWNGANESCVNTLWADSIYLLNILFIFFLVIRSFGCSIILFPFNAVIFSYHFSFLH